MSDVSRDSSAGSCKIVDSPKVMLLLIVSVICGFLGCLGIASLYAPNPGSFAILILLIPVCPILLWRFRVNAKGYIIDVENDALEFPGGGIEAESWLSYFNPMYWLQGFRRHRIPLSEIRHVEAYVETNRSVGSDGKVRTRKNKYLDIDGDFGAIQFSFSSKGKMGQLYSAIIQLNEMGFPVVGR